MPEKFKKERKKPSQKTIKFPQLPAGTLQPRALEKMSNKTNMERIQLKTMDVFMSPEAMKTKLLTFTVNSLERSRASFQIKKRRNKPKCYEFASRESYYTFNQNQNHDKRKTFLSK